MFGFGATDDFEKTNPMFGFGAMDGFERIQPQLSGQQQTLNQRQMQDVITKYGVAGIKGGLPEALQSLQVC